MLQSKYLLLIIPAVLLAGFLALSENTETTVHVRRSIAKAEPLVAPLRIAAVSQPIATEIPAQPEGTPQEAPPASAPAPAPKANVSAPRITAAANSATVAKTPAPKPAAPAPKPAAPTCSGSYAEQFLCLLNQYRASKGKGALSYDRSLSTVALSYSAWMAKTGTFSHTGSNGERAWDRCAAAGTSCLAENLAMGAGSAKNLLDMWIASPGHNANLLGSYSKIGLGVSGTYATTLYR